MKGGGLGIALGDFFRPRPRVKNPCRLNRQNNGMGDELIILWICLLICNKDPCGCIPVLTGKGCNGHAVLTRGLRAKD